MLKISNGEFLLSITEFPKLFIKHINISTIASILGFGKVVNSTEFRKSLVLGKNTVDIFHGMISRSFFIFF